MYIVWALSLLFITLTLLPFINSPRWWIRTWDYPRLQIATGLVVLIVLQALFFPETWANIGLLVASAAAFIWQAYSIWPYTRAHRVQSVTVEKDDKPNRVCIMVANVLQPNRNAEGLLAIVDEVDPDILITVETDAWWDKQLDRLVEKYPFNVRRPLENTYGMHLFSRLELRDVCLRELISPGIPSIRATVRLRSGKECDLYAVHPEPPLPHKDVEERDAELLIVARESKRRSRPTLVAGDLNDVAWSHTTRLFQRVSGLLDPRVGRGLFPTFHARYPFARWPLDHLFHDVSFKLESLKVLRGYGSDHFPICAAFVHDPTAVMQQEKPRSDQSDEVEATEKIEEGIAAADHRDEPASS